MSADGPPPQVLGAFGVDTAVRPLAGGQGGSWVAGDLVLKPEGGPVSEWLATALADLRPQGVRIASPVRTGAGAWTFRGWSAMRWVEGNEPDWSATSTWPRIIEAGRVFHRAVAHVARPQCLDAREDWWALADRSAWGERPLRLLPELADLARRLQPALEPLGRSQIVHGDLTGNVLFASGLDPVVIDISPYWRSVAYAEGIVLADALCWHGAPASVLEETGVTVPAVARALLFRLATTNEFAVSGARDVDLHGEARRYSLAAAALGL